jgi:YegS/Rv2252/BmrU family lipid kinase
MTGTPPTAGSGRTLIVLNPHAGGGRAGKLWTEIEPLLWQELGELVIAVTQRAADVAEHLDKAYAAGVRRVVSIGGDGTNHALVNALAAMRARGGADFEPVEYGILPIGTGRDWARGSGLPLHSLREAASWIARARPRPVDLGLLTLDAGDGAPDQREYFLNIASVGLSGAVTEYVNSRRARRPWTFLEATVVTLLRMRPPAVQLRVDDQDWYEGRAFLVAVANGTTFGHGMRIAPDAQTGDGLFDIVLVKQAPLASILMALRRVYTGTHVTHPAVRITRGRTVSIRGVDGPLGAELDGESARGSRLTFSVQPGALHMLV